MEVNNYQNSSKREVKRDVDQLERIGKNKFTYHVVRRKGIHERFTRKPRSVNVRKVHAKHANQKGEGQKDGGDDG